MPHVEAVEFGCIRVGKKFYYHDIWIHANGSVERRRLDTLFSRDEHLFSVGEFHELLKWNPKLIIIGTGYERAVNVSSGVVITAKNMGIEVLGASTPHAAKYYNRAVEEKVKVAAAFHVSC